MTNLTELITLWIGEDKDTYHTTGKPIYDSENVGFNLALKDLKSKIPDLIEQIEKLTLKGKRNRIIEMIRSEEREKLIKEALAIYKKDNNKNIK